MEISLALKETRFLPPVNQVEAEDGKAIFHHEVIASKCVAGLHLSLLPGLPDRLSQQAALVRSLYMARVELERLGVRVGTPFSDLGEKCKSFSAGPTPRSPLCRRRPLWHARPVWPTVHQHATKVLWGLVSFQSGKGMISE